MSESGDSGIRHSRIATFVDTHLSHWQKIAALLASIIAITSAVVGGVAWIKSRASVPPAYTSRLDAWGPDRETYAFGSSPEFPVLNSTPDNPVYGDEQNFVRIKHSGFADSTYADTLHVEVGDVLTVLVLVANDCMAVVCEEGPMMMRGLQVKVRNVDAGEVLAVTVYLRAQNAAEVWDGFYITVDTPARLTPLIGSSVMHTGDADFKIDDQSFANGGWVLLGQKRPDGQYPAGKAPNGDFRGFGYLTFDLRVSPL